MDAYRRVGTNGRCVGIYVSNPSPFPQSKTRSNSSNSNGRRKIDEKPDFEHLHPDPAGTETGTTTPVAMFMESKSAPSDRGHLRALHVHGLQGWRRITIDTGTVVNLIAPRREDRRYIIPMFYLQDGEKCRIGTFRRPRHLFTTYLPVGLRRGRGALRHYPGRLSASTCGNDVS